MTTKEEDLKNFQSEMIAFLEKDGIKYRLFKNRIYHVIVPESCDVDMKMVNVGYQFLKENGGGRFFNIFQFSSFSNIKPEMRAWAADESGNSNTCSDAILIKSLPQKIVADFYLKINNPKKPTKIFYSLEKALAWTFIQMDKSEGLD